MRINGNHQSVGIGDQGTLKMWQKPMDTGNSQESMGVSLAVTHSFGDMDPEEAISYSQIGTPMEQKRHQPTQKTFNPPIKNTRIGG